MARSVPARLPRNLGRSTATNACAPAAPPRFAVAAAGSRPALLLRAGEVRDLLLLLLEELRHHLRPLDGELVDLLVLRTGEGIEQLGDLVDLTRLKERLEVVVREADVARHLRFVRLERLDDAFEVALLSVEGREREQREHVV